MIALLSYPQFLLTFVPSDTGHMGEVPQPEPPALLLHTRWVAFQDNFQVCASLPVCRKEVQLQGPVLDHHRPWTWT